jgi:carboxyl-terminal processing protease
MGNTTYGKGLVQQIFPISNDGSMALKLTTAKYYVPSGRCIQKPETQEKRSGHASTLTSEDESDTLVIADKEVFYTNGGRIVYGGGGIIPDVEVERETWKTIEINLERKSMFFDFAIEYISEHPDITPEFEVTDKMIDTFRQFIEEKEFTYKSALQVALEDLQKTVSESDKDDVFESSLANLRKVVDQEKERDLNESIDYIKRAIKREIVSSIAGDRGIYENIVLKTDKTVQEAVRILSKPKEYSRLISADHTSKEDL